jgi:hypothetical protein
MATRKPDEDWASGAGVATMVDIDLSIEILKSA